MWFAVDYSIEHLVDRVRVTVGFHSGFSVQSVVIGESTSPWVDQSATWLTASWFVGKLSCNLEVHVH